MCQFFVVVLILACAIVLPEQIHLNGKWDAAQMGCCSNLVDGRESSEEKRKIAPMHIEPGLHPSIVDIVVAMNNKIRKRLGAQTIEHNGIYVSVDKITQKIAFH